MRLYRDLVYFFFPHCCEVCGRLLLGGEEIMCSYCYLDLPRTNFHKRGDNPVEQLFWGRVEIRHATSFFFFNKGSEYQQLLHKLKYKGYGQIGEYLGRIFASEIRETVFAGADCIIPVPLHPRKKRKRGYNQSEKIGHGMGEVLGIPQLIDVLIRSENTDSQTRRGRFERYLNMKGRFIVRDKSVIEGKVVILLDDVVTTGSTVEACAQVLLDAGCEAVLLATVAVA